MSGKYENLTGQVVNGIEFMGHHENTLQANGKTKWRLKCHCGNEFTCRADSIKGGHTKSCGCLKLRKGSDHPAYKTGKTKDRRGYVLINSIHEDGNKRYKFEHRLVMEKHLGRPLKTNENVHHINGKKDDNRIENLELWVSSQPSGQRVPDLIKWAKEILETYDV
jgi:hypothetical protein